jgi:hypothetical protein
LLYTLIPITRAQRQSVQWIIIPAGQPLYTKDCNCWLTIASVWSVGLDAFPLVPANSKPDQWQCCTTPVLRRLLELYDKAPREFKDCIECLDYYT